MLPNELLDLLNNNDWENAIIFLNQITGDLNDEELAALARCYSRSSIYDSAIEKYTELISRQPETAKWYYCRGRQHYMKRLWEDAIADFSKALAINKDYFIVKYSIAYAYIQLSGSAARRSEDSFSKAIQHIEDCHELYGEYSDEEKIKNKSTYANICALHGRAIMPYKKHLDRSIELLKKAIELKPCDDFKYQLAKAYCIKKEYDEALKILPETDKPYYIPELRSQILSGAGKYSDSNNVLKDLIKVSKKGYLYRRIAENFLALKEINKAFKFAVLAIRSDKYDYKNYLLIGLIQKEQKMFRSAISSFSMAGKCKKKMFKADCPEAAAYIDEINRITDNNPTDITAAPAQIDCDEKTIKDKNDATPDIAEPCETEQNAVSDDENQDNIPAEESDQSNDDNRNGENGKTAAPATAQEPAPDVPQDDPAPAAPQKPPLCDVRFLIGKDPETEEEYFWEFGNKSLNNRHLLINGNSGCGKTYCIQTLLLEMVRSGVSGIVFDYTSGFTPGKLDPLFIKELGKRVRQRVVYLNKIPVNPFARQIVKVGGSRGLEKDVSVATRLANVFTTVYGFGGQQKSALYKAIKNGLQNHKSNMSFTYLEEELNNISAKQAETVLSKIQPFLDLEPFAEAERFNWGAIRDSDGMVYIMQLDGFDRPTQLLLTELLLWDIWNYCVQNGDEEHPFVIVLDEAQNLSHSAESPSAKFLTEGRKFGISAWYATQFMKPQLSDDEIQRLQQAGQKLYFCPPDDGVLTVAKNIDIDTQGAKEWAPKLKELKKGECVTCGNMVKDGEWAKYEPKIVKVTSLQDRLTGD